MKARGALKRAGQQQGHVRNGRESKVSILSTFSYQFRLALSFRQLSGALDRWRGGRRHVGAVPGSFFSSVDIVQTKVGCGIRGYGYCGRLGELEARA